jgi:hypothetical protein
MNKRKRRKKGREGGKFSKGENMVIMLQARFMSKY